MAAPASWRLDPAAAGLRDDVEARSEAVRAGSVAASPILIRPRPSASPLPLTALLPLPLRRLSSERTRKGWLTSRPIYTGAAWSSRPQSPTCPYHGGLGALHSSVSVSTVVGEEGEVGMDQIQFEQLPALDSEVARVEVVRECGGDVATPGELSDDEKRAMQGRKFTPLPPPPPSSHP
ncbi:hypothetical protein BS78_05G067500 [Paspalum vaginatum]|nr:hypothetical protein BS78_05G067500 [Paspalum vaginatum]